MSSPFSIFRRHQRVLMVAVTVLAMISFVLVGAVSHAREMPPSLGVLFFAAVVGGIAGIFGLSYGKATEYASLGAIFAALLGMLIIVNTREPVAVHMDG